MYEFSTRDKLAAFIAEETVNTTEALIILGCTRQNLADLVARGKLVPIKDMPQDRLFWKSDVLQRAKDRRS